MDSSQDINHILSEWPFDPYKVNVRRIQLEDREILQMRIDLGLLQLETSDRPDGQEPGGQKTYYHFLQKQAAESNDDFQLDEEACLQVDREFVQFYNRRVCWLQLKEFGNAVRDADHTLALMDFCEQHSKDESWTVSHEQYRPFVLYHRTQAAALEQLRVENESDETERPEYAEAAIKEINQGLDTMRNVFEKYEAEDRFDNDELVSRLMEFRESLRKRYDVGKTLEEQLSDAIDNEQYERAAEIRDLIERRKGN